MSLKWNERGRFQATQKRPDFGDEDDDDVDDGDDDDAKTQPFKDLGFDFSFFRNFRTRLASKQTVQALLK